MHLTPIICIGILFSLAAVVIARSISNSEYFSSAIKVYKELSKREIRDEATGKRKLRRLRKIRSELRKVRKRLTILFILNVTVFSLMYVLASIIIYALYPGEKGFLEIPLSIPLFTLVVRGHYYTHAIAVAFIAFMAPSYLFARIMRL